MIKGLRTEERRRIVLLVLAMLMLAVVTCTVMGIMLYGMAARLERETLLSVADSQVDYVLELTHFNRSDSPNLSNEQLTQLVVSELKQNFGHLPSFGSTGEVLIGEKRDDGSITYLASNRWQAAGEPQDFVIASLKHSVPMQSALAGRHGTLIGKDYRGTEVLAAYAPVSGMNWGVVAKVDMAEIRLPFLQTAAIVVLIAILAMVLLATWFHRATSPLILQLAASEEQLRLLLDSTAEAIYGVDLEGNCTFCNPACLRLLGYGQADELLGKNMQELLHHAHADKTPDSLDQGLIQIAIREGSNVHADDEVLWRADGTSFNAEYWSYPQRKDAKVVGAVVAFLDVTERKAIEDCLVFLLECGNANSGEDFFASLARYLAVRLGMDYVCIDRLLTGGLAAQTVAVYSDGAFEDNVEYTLKDTPCGDVVGMNTCCFHKDVRQLFPHDEVLQQMLAESYVGATLWSSAGEPIGLIALISRRPLENPHLVESLLKLVAVRAAGELERREAEDALREANERVVAANEELFATNEELTAVNEEMTAVNEELTSTIEVLAKSQQDLAEAKGYAEMLIETANVMVVGLDAEGRVTLLNQSAEHVLGYGRQELLGRDYFANVLPPDHQAAVRYAFENWRDTVPDIQQYYVNPVLTKSGELRTIEWRKSILRKDGKFAGTVSFGIDITERLAAEAARAEAEMALRESEARHRRLYDAGLFGVIFWNMDGQITDANDKFLAMVGYSRDELAAGQIDWVSMTSPEQRYLDEISIAEIKATGANRVPFEKDYIRKDGSRLPIMIAGATMDEQRTRGVAFIVDISARKQMEETLRESELTYRTLGEAIDYGVWMCDADGLNTYASESFLRMVGRSFAEIQEFGWLDRLPPQDVEPTVEHWMHCVRTGEDFEHEHHFRSATGETRNVLAIGRPIRNAQGEIRKWVGLNLDITELKRVENELREKEQLLSESQRVAHLGSWSIQLPGFELAWSDEAHHVWGVPSDYPLDFESFMALIHPDDRALMEEWTRACLADEEPHDLDFRAVRPDGTVRILRGQGKLITDAQHNAVRMAGTIQDITERKKAEEALRETSSYLDKLIGYANAPIIVWDTEYRITRFNHAFEALTGRRAAETVGRSLDLLFPPEQAAESMQLIRRTLTGERWEAVEIQIMHLDGSLKTVLWNSATIYASDGATPVATIAQGHDISERKQAEMALIASETRYRRLFESAKDGILILDAETGAVDDVNPYLSELLGLSYDQLYGKKVWELGFLKDVAAHKDNFLELQQREYVRFEDLPLETQHGQKIDVEFVSNVYQVDGKVVVQCNIRNITDRKQAELALRKLHAELEMRVEERTAELAQANEALEQETAQRIDAQEKQLTAVLEERTRIAREFHDTLAQGFAGIVIQLEGADAALAEDTRATHAHLDQARQLARESLAAARRSVWALRPEALEEGDLVDAVHSFIDKLDHDSAIQLEFTHTGTRSRLLHIVEDELLRVTQEAVMNAVRHAEAALVRVALEFSDTMVEMRVEDDGRGFEVAGVPHHRCFGLRIMKERVTNIRGDLEITSQPGKGTQVLVRVPRYADDIGEANA